MAHAMIDHRHPDLAPSSVEGAQRNRVRLHIPVALDLGLLLQGGPSRSLLKFTLAPGSTAPDARLLAERTLEQAVGAEKSEVGDAVELQWRDGFVWRPFATLEHMSEERMLTRWMLKTPRNYHREHGAITGLETIAHGHLKAHFANKGGEVPPDRELSAWPSFLSSYRAELVASGKTRKLMGRSADLCGTAAVKPSKVVKDAGGKKPANLVAVTSQETERHAIEGGMPLPKALLSKAGRVKAAVLLSVTRNAQLMLRFIPKPGREAEFSSSFSPGLATAPADSLLGNPSARRPGPGLATGTDSPTGRLQTFERSFLASAATSLPPSGAPVKSAFGVPLSPMRRPASHGSAAPQGLVGSPSGLLRDPFGHFKQSLPRSPNSRPNSRADKRLSQRLSGAGV